MKPVSETVEKEVLEIRRAQAKAALKRIRAKARADGLDKLTMKQIDAIVAEVRQELRGRK